jgi:Nse4 C-terminal
VAEHPHYPEGKGSCPAAADAEREENENLPKSWWLFFRFVIHPDCFGQTVENMFYVSFLVKEGRAKVFVDPDNNLPKICPVRKAGTQVSMLKNALFSFSLKL